MKDNTKLIKIIIITAITVFFSSCFAYTININNPTVPATEENSSEEETSEDISISSLEGFPAKGLLYDMTEGKLLYASGENERTAPASFTKLLTAVTALKYSAADSIYEVGSERNIVMSNSSLCYIEVGDRITLYNLICGMLLCSGNDAAYTIAAGTAKYVSGNYDMPRKEALDFFCRLMNETAQELGAQNSNFTNPDGWDDENQYTTLSDMLKIAVYVMNDSTLSEIVKMPRAEISLRPGHSAVWKNSNQLLDVNSPYYYPGANGIKTGTTDSAGRSLTASAYINGKTYIAITAGNETEQERYSTVISMFDSVS